MFEAILNPIFEPLLKMPLLAAVLIISFLISLFITFVYKWMTDQTLMKSLKEDIKKFQKQMKEFKEHPQKVIEVQKKAMETNMKYMMHSMKPTLITFIPIIIIFGWMHGHLAYEPINPGEEFRVAALFGEGVNGEITINVPEGIILMNDARQEIKDNKVVWSLEAEENGNYWLEYKFNELTYNQEVLISEKQEYSDPRLKVNENGLSEIKVNNQPTKLLNLFGWKIGWLGTYIIFSIIFSMSLRKLMKLH